MCGHVDPELARTAGALREAWLRVHFASGLERLRRRLATGRWRRHRIRAPRPA